MNIDPPVPDHIEEILKNNNFKKTSKGGLWVRYDQERSDFIDFRKGDPAIYSYEENESAGVTDDMKRIKKRIRVEYSKDQGGQETLF